MSEERKQVLDLLKNCFPKPALPASIDELRTLDLKEQDRLEGELYAHQAVHEFDPFFREQFISKITERLLNGDPLAIPERAWLIYVLDKLGRAENIPNEYKGRAPTPDIERVGTMLSLGAALAETPSKEKITERLRKAADAMNKGYETVRAIYYSPAYKSFSQSSLFQRWTPKAGADISTPMKLGKVPRVKKQHLDK